MRPARHAKRARAQPQQIATHSSLCLLAWCLAPLVASAVACTRRFPAESKRRQKEEEREAKSRAKVAEEEAKRAARQAAAEEKKRRREEEAATKKALKVSAAEPTESQRERWLAQAAKKGYTPGMRVEAALHGGGANGEFDGSWYGAIVVGVHREGLLLDFDEADGMPAEEGAIGVRPLRALRKACPAHSCAVVCQPHLDRVCPLHGLAQPRSTRCGR